MPRATIQHHDFNLADEVTLLRAGDARVGAVCSFVGTVRDRNAAQAAGSVSAMELEHYPGMTEKAIETMIDAAHQCMTTRGVHHRHVSTVTTRFTGAFKSDPALMDRFLKLARG